MPAPAMLMSARDNIVKVYMRNDFPKAGAKCAAHRTTEHSDYPDGANKRVRMFLNMQVITEMIGERTMKLTVICFNNPGGSIPKSLTNMMAAKMSTSMIETYRGFIKKMK